jgi:hypothetical protein
MIYTNRAKIIIQQLLYHNDGLLPGRRVYKIIINYYGTKTI